MEPHPVPQNVLEVEFKLFGAFTLKQFLRILFGCLFALFIFLLQLPFYVKYPIMAASVLTGVGLAIVPNFGVWLSGFLKALFISPRYVWVKETNTPDILKGKAQPKVNNHQKVEKQKKNKRADLAEISLEKLLGSSEPSTRGYTATDKSDETEEDGNLDRLLGEVYSTRGVRKTEPIQKAAEPKTQQYYINEINKLKYELSNLVKDQHYKEKESEILSRINDLYQELKFTPTTAKVPAALAQKPAPQVLVTNEKGEDVNAIKQNVFGIIVDKNDQPVPDAVVKFDNPENENDFAVKSSSDGRFTSSEKLPAGTYNIVIEHPTLKFHSYKIIVGDSKLPAYKLRAR